MSFFLLREVVKITTFPLFIQKQGRYLGQYACDSHA